MRSRHTITDLFSTFLQFADDRMAGWTVDARLRRSIQRCLEQQPTDDRVASESFWATYWHRCWQTEAQRLAEAHLAAYLQEACYWAAHNSAAQLAHQHYPVSDCFQIAIAYLPRVLASYNSNQPASIKTFATNVFSNAIRDTLRQQKVADSRSDWGLLRKVSQKRLREALTAGGVASDVQAQYQLAWFCFKTVGVSAEQPGGELVKATQPEWDAIAQLYNQQRQRLSSSAPATSPTAIEQWLKLCAKQVRTYLHPAVGSLNQTLHDDSGTDLQDTLADSQLPPMAALISQDEIHERKTYQQQVNTVLTAALQALNPQTQTLLTLYFQQGLTQQAIAAQLEIKQYTVSRRFSSAKEALLLALATWSQETLHISPTPTVLKDMSGVVEEWMQGHFRQLASTASEEGFST